MTVKVRKISDICFDITKRNKKRIGNYSLVIEQRLFFNGSVLSISINSRIVYSKIRVNLRLNSINFSRSKKTKCLCIFSLNEII